MTLKAPRTFITLTAMVALSGCQSGPRWAWWKHDAAPDSSAIARSAGPALPSAQSTPQPVAVAGLTPSAPPSSANLAAANSPAAASVAASTLAVPPNVSIPVTSSGTVANTPQAAYPNAANSLADKLTAAPSATTNATSAGLPATSLPVLPSTSPTSHPLAAATAPPSTGPYDPKAYKPAAALASTGADAKGDAGEADRYGMSSASYATAPTSMPQSTASLPSNRYGAVPPTTTPTATAQDTAVATTSTAASTSSSQLPAQPAAPVSDRYAMPSTVLSSASVNPPLTSTATAGPAATAVANPTPAVRSTAAVGAYRPGGTSSYTPGATSVQIEVATRPAPPSPTIPAVAPIVTPGAQSEPWAPPAPSAMPTSTRTY